jgi:hypothetical protein
LHDHCDVHTDCVGRKVYHAENQQQRSGESDARRGAHGHRDAGGKFNMGAYSMTGWDVFFKVASEHSGSFAILILAAAFTGFYAVQITIRIMLVERQFAAVVTKTDLLEFEKRLMEALDERYRRTKECDLYHTSISDHLAIMDKRIDRKADMVLVTEIIKQK